MMEAPHFSIAAVDCRERPVTLRLPFRFGAATVREAPQAFVRARLVTPDGRSTVGYAAELMIPKWFDKAPSRTNAENIDDLRASLAAAAAAYASERHNATAFGHTARHYLALLGDGAAAGRNALTSCYGPALIDRAVLDALCRLEGRTFVAAMRANLPGLDARLTPDLHDFTLGPFLASLPARDTIAARHTIGLADPLDGDDATVAGSHRLPVTLAQVIRRYGHRHFKVKLCGDANRDLARLVDIAAVLDRLPEYAVTLDGNEQFADLDAVRAFREALAGHATLQRLAAAVLYFEQPLPRAHTFARHAGDAARHGPLLLDEADQTLDAFAEGLRCGYAGVSSKSCKGVYKSLLNAARCAQWNARAGAPLRAFMSGEDLTAQAGLALQQDLALVGLLGLRHVERNGHHYVDGFAGQHASEDEATAFLNAHGDLYSDDEGNVRLRIEQGRLSFASLDTRGFASAAWPDFAALAPLGAPAPVD
jgi:hypothetical protein